MPVTVEPHAYSYGRAADAYERGRPGYPAAAVAHETNKRALLAPVQPGLPEERFGGATDDEIVELICALDQAEASACFLKYATRIESTITGAI